MINKQYLTKSIQIMLAIGILTVIFFRIDISKVNSLLRHTNHSYICLALLLLTCQTIVATYRWLGLLRLAGFYPSVWQCVGCFAAGTFVNTMLPGGFAGDLMRTWFTARNGVPSGIAAYIVIADRILGIIGYILLVATILLFSTIWVDKHIHGLYIITILFCISLLTGFAGLLLISPVINRLKIKLLLILSPIVGLSHIIGTIFNQPYNLLKFFSINLIVHFIQIAAVIITAYALNIHLSPQAAFIGIPIVLLLSAIPLTPGGWGIRESNMVFVLGQFQVSTEPALVISILFGIIFTLSNLPASTWWFLHIIRAKKLGNLYLIDQPPKECYRAVPAKSPGQY